MIQCSRRCSCCCVIVQKSFHNSCCSAADIFVLCKQNVMRHAITVVVIHSSCRDAVQLLCMHAVLCLLATHTQRWLRGNTGLHTSGCAADQPDAQLMHHMLSHHTVFPPLAWRAQGPRGPRGTLAVHQMLLFRPGSSKNDTLRLHRNIKLQPAMRRQLQMSEMLGRSSLACQPTFVDLLGPSKSSLQRHRMPMQVCNCRGCTHERCKQQAQHNVLLRIFIANIAAAPGW
ncbi:hypothetical protein COO60DRAFT_449988 [Scenedesmus sp. NREL 46B-D3]|nr:hypothetical protein COO60DRAFT_449988 [Scenedesmus sp. NREL 46B-D3]